MALILVAALAWDMFYYVDYPQFNTMWESAPLQVAWNVARGKTAYLSWEDGPIHLAIYGPLYYYLTGFLGWLGGAQPHDMIAAGRWLSVTAFGVGLVGVFAYTRRSGVPWWATLVSLGCVAFITPTGIRFISSARPDALAAACSVWAVLFITMTGRRATTLSALLLVAAIQTRPNALAGAVAVFLFLAVNRQWRRLFLWSTLLALGNGLILAGFWWATNGWIWRHLTFSGHAPMGWQYTWNMLTANGCPVEITLLLALPLSALLILRLRHVASNALPPLAPYMTLAAIYYCTSLVLALAWSLRQGSDRNYLIEPALAAGMLLGVWCGYMAHQRKGTSCLLGRCVAVLALFAVAVHCLPSAFTKNESKRRLAKILSPYDQEHLDSCRRLTGRLLSLDSWLAFRAGIDNDLNDPIAYYSYARTENDDPITQRVKDCYYDHVITWFLIEKDPPRVYDDIQAAWPRLLQGLQKNYQLCQQWGIWYVYQPTPPLCTSTNKESSGLGK